MTSMNGPSARDSASGKAARDAGAGEGSPVTKTQFLTVVHNGELPAVRVGRSFRVHAKAVHDLLESSYFDAG